jgi:hypothetical protein
MATGIEPITLPWKRPEKGVSAAELGASFRVEQREDGWHCTVRVGRRTEVLATGMRRLRDAQCRAEAHAATLPEVAAALAQADAARAAAKGPERAAAKPRPTVSTFEQVSDGCICGKLDSGTWIADPAGKVSVPAGTDPEMAKEICRVAAKHYAAQREAGEAAKMADVAAKTAAKATARAAAKTAKTAARATARAAAKTAKTAKPAKPEKTAAAKMAKTAAAKTVTTAKTKTTAKTTAKSAKATAKTVAAAEPAGDKAKRGGSKAANKKAAKKATQRRGPKFTPQPFGGINAPPGPSPEAVRILVAEAAANERAAGRKATAKGPRGRRGKGKQAKAAAATAQEEPMGKRSDKAKGEPCGCVTWTEVEGKARGEAKHGAFVVEPEGKKHALYFYDAEGQSRHIQSGEAVKLRKVAEEMAARGQPAPRAASAGDDGALLKMFMAGAMEEEA